MVQIRVWKYLDMSGVKKQLIDLVECQKENVDLFMEQLEDLYTSWNTFIEIKEVQIL